MTVPAVADVAPRPALFLTSDRLNSLTGLDITLASETLQYTGSFKFRGAFNTAAQTSASHLIGISSGNFGQALAFACKVHGKRCTIVMPETSSTAKVDAVRAYGARVELVDTRTTPRVVRQAELLAEFPGAVGVYPSDGEPMLSGNESLGAEILTREPVFDAVIAPIGGGGVVVGLIRASWRLQSTTEIWAAEPTAANDVAQSFRNGRLTKLAAESASIADGVRGLGLSEANWSVVRDGCRDVIEVEESRIVEATRLLFSLANLKAEPTGALALAAAMTQPQPFVGKRVCCVVTGGNVDPELYASILAPADR